MVVTNPASGGGRGVPVGGVAAMSVGDYTTQVERCQAELVVELTKHADRLADMLDSACLMTTLPQTRDWCRAVEDYYSFVGEC